MNSAITSTKKSLSFKEGKGSFHFLFTCSNPSSMSLSLESHLLIWPLQQLCRVLPPTAPLHTICLLFGWGIEKETSAACLKPHKTAIGGGKDLTSWPVSEVTTPIKYWICRTFPWGHQAHLSDTSAIFSKGIQLC